MNRLSLRILGQRTDNIKLNLFKRQNLHLQAIQNKI